MVDRTFWYRQVMPTKTTPAPSARDRLLAAANELFYKEGVHSVGVDRVIDHAGVAKASLYNTFGSKDELVKSYLALRQESRRARIERHLAKWNTPQEKILAVFDAMAELTSEPTFRGCAFVNASAELQSDGVADICENARAYVRGVFNDLASAAGASDPDTLARQLVLIYDGAVVGAQMDRNSRAPQLARETAQTLLDISLGA
jgi:AcrR family transcriptional regulator